ncbi:hypothetical protein [Prosthecobacter sp.]|uniref:hypothetical protein n=1 Tax=Prosthecobacter sp. TaxID=1965333 RepID=UPI003782ECD7
MKKDIESTLRAQSWRDPPPEFLERVLKTAMEESQRNCERLRDSVVPKRAPRLLALLTFIPRPLRLPLAACWLLAFFFRATTPEAIPQSTLDSYAKLPPLTPAQLLANRKQIEQLANELRHPQHHGPQPPL